MATMIFNPAKELWRTMAGGTLRASPVCPSGCPGAQSRDDGEFLSRLKIFSFFAGLPSACLLPTWHAEGRGVSGPPPQRLPNSLAAGLDRAAPAVEPKTVVPRALPAMGLAQCSGAAKGLCGPQFPGKTPSAGVSGSACAAIAAASSPA